MLGAIIGDIAGSRFEFHNHRSKQFEFFSKECFATDDSLMTLCVAKAVIQCYSSKFAPSDLQNATVKYMQEIGRKYPNCGFGEMFHRWVFSDNPQSYNSYGNGAAMRVSPCAFAASTEEEAKLLSRIVTEVTHDHPEGIKGAEAVSVAIFMAKNGATKKEIRKRMEKDYYKLDFTLDDIREAYQFNETCQGTVPQAIEAFLEALTFEDAIRNAISIGGDSDTLAAITGSIAEAYYGVPKVLEKAAVGFLPSELRRIYYDWCKFGWSLYRYKKLGILTKYIGTLSDEKEIYSFKGEFYVYAQLHEEHGLANYAKILEQRGLAWKSEIMRRADITELEETAVLALVMGLLRADHFSQGIFEEWCGEGVVDQWLIRLQQIDDQRQYATDDVDVVGLKIDVFSMGRVESLEIQELKILRWESTSYLGEMKHVYHLERGLFSELVEKIFENVRLALSADCWIDSEEVHLSGSSYELTVRYADTSEVQHRGIYDRVHIPEKEWCTVMELLYKLLCQFTSDDIMNRSGFMNAIKPGEVKYCGVEFSEDGKLYHYRTGDLHIVVGDRVIVPVGSGNYEREAIVKTVEFCHWDDTPYPLEETKQIIGKVSEDTDVPPLLIVTDAQCMQYADMDEV